MEEVIKNLFKDIKVLSTDCGSRVREMVSKKYETKVKADKSFVTEVDLEIEQMVRDFVSKNYPEHGIVGEEKDDVNPDSDFQWIVDPIDGTQNLVHGIPTYGIVIGVYFKGENIAGAINHPILNLEYYAAKGHGAYKNGQRIKIEDCDLFQGKLDPQEVLTISTRSIFERSGEEEIFDSLVREYPAHRVFYDIFSTTRAIEGQAAAVVEFNMKVWDIAATDILIKEAGGVCKIVREVHKPGSKTMYSLIAGKPTAVKHLIERFGDFRKLELS